MISKDMYELIKYIPRHPNVIKYEDLASLQLFSDVALNQLLCEAKHSDYEYIEKTYSGSPVLAESSFFRTEKGQAALEMFEQEVKSQKMMKSSLVVSKIAMWAAIASAVAAIASLVKMFF